MKAILILAIIYAEGKIAWLNGAILRRLLKIFHTQLPARRHVFLPRRHIFRPPDTIDKYDISAAMP